MLLLLFVHQKVDENQTNKTVESSSIVKNETELSIESQAHIQEATTTQSTIVHDDVLDNKLSEADKSAIEETQLEQTDSVIENTHQHEDDFEKENTNQNYSAHNSESSVETMLPDDQTDTDAPQKTTPKLEDIVEVETTPVEPTPTIQTEDYEYNNRPDYLGRFKIPAVGVNVACFNGSSQALVDAYDSAAYFHLQDHAVIGDHWNQGFDGIKQCVVGTQASLITNEETRNYVCIDKINGHNTGYQLTDNNYTPINDLYPGSLVCYTCNDNWQNITIAFFVSPNDVDKYTNPPVDMNQDEPYAGTSDEPEIIRPQYRCGNGEHFWCEWEIAWEAESQDGTKYGWDKRMCKICEEEEWQQRTYPHQ